MSEVLRALWLVLVYAGTLVLAGAWYMRMSLASERRYGLPWPCRRCGHR